MRKQTFSRWWQAMNRAPQHRRDENFHRWLTFACKTVAHRGDQNQQRVVYTIQHRYHNSEYRKISRANAQRVWKIINTKTDKPVNPQPKTVVSNTRPEVQIVRKVRRRTIAGGVGRQKD